MRILIAGATGFIGRRLIAQWREQHELVLVGRNQATLSQQFPTFRCVAWQNLASIMPSEIDVVVNLAGETINHIYWTTKIKQAIVDSRITATQTLVKWVLDNPNEKLHFCNTSALSIYGLYSALPSQIPSENTVTTTDSALLCQVAQQWEACLHPLIKHNIPTSILRFAVVLDAKEGAFPSLLRPAQFGLASKMGTGKQPFAWISITDLVRGIDWVIHHKIRGAINFVAPTLLTQDQFNTTLCHHLHRPYLLTLPAGMIKLFLRQMGDELLLHGPAGYPSVLEKSGFVFNEPTLSTFLEHHLLREKLTLI